MVWTAIAEYSDEIISRSILQHLCSNCSQGLIIRNNRKIVVGVSQRIDSVEGRDELRDALDQRLIQWLTEAGFLPVAIPNILSVTDSSNESRFENWIQAVQPRALILSGGNDVGEYQVRDKTERHLLSWAEEQKVPVLGICRGMQMMAVWSGGNLIKKEGHVRSRHQLIITGPKNEWPAHVNSYHNWILESCPDGFEVVAQSDDGTIEAIKHKHLPLEGWMWHPERENPFSQPDIKRIQRLFIGQ